MSECVLKDRPTSFGLNACSGDVAYAQGYGELCARHRDRLAVFGPAWFALSNGLRTERVGGPLRERQEECPTCGHRTTVSEYAHGELRSNA